MNLIKITREGTGAKKEAIFPMAGVVGARPNVKAVCKPVAKTAARNDGLKEGSLYLYPYGGTLVPVLLKSVESDGSFVVNVALRSDDGTYLVGDGPVVLPGTDKLTKIEGVSKSVKIRAFDEHNEFEIVGEKAKEIKDKSGRIIDYLDVKIGGYASTFQNYTAADRDGDYIMDGAFKETIAAFMKNPVLLTDHENSVKSLAGSFTKLATNKQGLGVEASVSNAPGLIDTRFKIVERHLKGLSIGGLFMFAGDGHGIVKVSLYEISLTPVPANQDALFNVRSLTMDDAKSFLMARSRKAMNIPFSL